MKLTIDINTEQIYEDGFEAALMDAIVKKLADRISNKADSLITEKTSALMVAAIDRAVDNKLKNLLDEPIVMTDRYGAKKFLGSVEDYIKMEIDNRLLRPVDSHGKTLTGSCSNSDAKNWIEWSFEKTAKEEYDRATTSFKMDVSDKISRIVKGETEKIISQQTSNAISTALSRILAK